MKSILRGGDRYAIVSKHLKRGEFIERSCWGEVDRAGLTQISGEWSY